MEGRPSCSSTTGTPSPEPAHDLERAGAKVVVRQAAECQPRMRRVAGIVLSPALACRRARASCHSWPRGRPGSRCSVCASACRPSSNGGGRLRQLDAVRRGVSSEARRLVADPMLADTGERFAVGHYHEVGVRTGPPCRRSGPSPQRSPPIPPSSWLSAMVRCPSMRSVSPGERPDAGWPRHARPGSPPSAEPMKKGAQRRLFQML